jgi:amino acid adenylation domain-containing protein
MKAELSFSKLKASATQIQNFTGSEVKCVHQFFEAQVEKTPEAIAIAFGNEQINYRELDHRANQLATYLIAYGLTPGSICGIALERSIDMFIGVLAILKAGAAYAPLDPCYPEERLKFMIADAQIPLVLSQKQIAEKLSGCSATLVLTEEIREAIESYGTAKPTPNSYGPAYVIFTSGSTGEPKALAMGHAALINLLRWQQESSRLAGNGKTTVQFASLSFDVSFQEIFSTWSVGGKLVLIREELRRDLRGLWQILISEKVERLFLPPVVLRHLALASERDPGVPTSLREIIVAGEQLQISTAIRRMFARLPGCTLQNQYGPSESHVVTSYRLPEDPAAWSELAPIGGAIANVEIHVLDEHLQPVDAGTVGEIYIGGVCLCEGYVNRQALTNEKFIPHPYSERTGNNLEPNGDRLYKTGDLARQLPDGNLEFLGRVDHQIKVRGHRIEAGEVEAALLSHPLVNEAIVMVRQDSRLERHLVGYVVTEDPAPLTDELRTHLTKTLPSFMIPSSFVYLKSLPLTPNGKVNRAALPDLRGERPKLQHLVANPSNEIEKRLVEIWERVLNIHQIGILDDFFELGGDSLLVVHMLIEINEEFGQNLAPSTLLAHGTIKSLATALAVDSQEQQSSIVAIKPTGKLPPLFLLPPMAGEVLGYRSLAPHLDAEQPLYGIRALGLDGKVEPFRDLVKMAEFHLNELLSFQPSEPFLIGGYSMGGIVAFEMAHQLYERGFRDIKVLIIDEEAPLSAPLDLAGLVNIMRNLPKWFVPHVVRRPRSELIMSIRGNAARVLRLAKKAFRRSSATIQPDYRGEISEFLDLSQLAKPQLHLCTAMWEALLQYRPKVYPGQLILLRTRSQRLMSTKGFDKGWKQLAQGVKIRLVEGNHNTVGEGPNAKGLAREITSLLGQAQPLVMCATLLSVF